MIVLLDAPVVLANHACHEFELQMYGFDPTMAPTGKGVIKVELTTQYSYWKELAADRQRYAEAKQQVADRVVDLLEALYFTGFRKQVEVVDVSTLITWERFTGGTMGLGIYPTRKGSIIGSIVGKSQASTLPGLTDFYFAGTWDTSMGALFMNALSGKRVIQGICRRDKRDFTAH
jgi:phytoene dehydrogenase-like protein